MNTTKNKSNTIGNFFKNLFSEKKEQTIQKEEPKEITLDRTPKKEPVYIDYTVLDDEVIVAEGCCYA